MDAQFQNYWENTLKLLHEENFSVAIDTIIKKIEPLYIRDGCFIFKAPDKFYKTTIEHRYLNQLEARLVEVSGRDCKIKIVLADELNGNNEFHSGIISKKSIEELTIQSNLKSKYIFETFVKGKSNELAYAASQAVAEDPGLTIYNPLFLYGGVGLGKTHLMHSIGNYILEQDMDKRVLYTSTESFTNELITSIRERKNQEFRNKYRDIDVLLIDDIQFLTEKESTQEEFFHTFNTLYGANKQLVISSDQPPKELKTLEDRLRSRFGSGLIVDITLPDFETRTAILEKKAEMEKLNVPKEVTKFIAKSIVSNIRDLEGALIKVTAYARLVNAEITLELAERALKDLISENERREITVEYIQEVVANYYNLSTDDIKGKRRTQSIVYPRQIAMYLSRKLIDISLPKIGALFGGRDHSTIIHGCDKITDELERDPSLKNVMIDLEKKILND